MSAAAGAGAGPYRNRSNSSNSNTHRRRPYLRDPAAVTVFALKTREAARLATGDKVTFRFPAGLKPSPDCIARLQEFLLFDREVVAADPGYYTWMLKVFGAGAAAVMRLVAAPVYSKQEVGTLHANLDALTVDGTVWFAGELLITPDRQIVYNILSGTYTAILNANTQVARKTSLTDFLETLGVARDRITLAGGGTAPLLETGGNFPLPAHMEELYTGPCGMGATAFVAPKKARGGARTRRRRYTLKRGRSPRSKRRAH